jgi:nucleotide-binding universal stress UspA family protein
MLILETKEVVTILTVGRDDAVMERQSDMLREHLDRHGVTTEWRPLRPDGLSTAAAILDWCAANDPELLIMGAYEHSKFRDDLIGGVTNAVLAGAACPVLMAH